MDAKAYWNEYVVRTGGVKAVSEKLDTPIQTIYSITNGHRGIGRRLAKRFVARDPLLDPNKLIWVRPTREGVSHERPDSHA